MASSTLKTLAWKSEATAPQTLRDPGDDAFEATRAVAQSEHDKLLKVIGEKRTGIKFAKAQLELATAKKHISPLLQNMPDQWASDHHIRVLREKQPDKTEKVVGYDGHLSTSHINHARGALAKFARFMSGRHGTGKNMAGVMSEQVRAFMDSIEKERLSARTWNYYLVILREMFERHEPDSGVAGTSESERNRVPGISRDLRHTRASSRC